MASFLGAILENRIRQQLQTLESFIAAKDLVAPRISAWSIAQQLEHTFSVSKAIALQLTEERPQEHGSPTLIGWIVLLVGRIPRGKGRSPTPFLPAEVGLSADALQLQATQTREAIEVMIEAGDYARLGWKHPSLGVFSGNQWLRFIDIHQRHHLAIIKEIANSSAAQSLPTGFQN